MMEKILCAAIYFNDGKQHAHQPKNITQGFVVTGRRHHNCYATLAAIANSIDLDKPIRSMIDRADNDSQGFITDLDRYVDRKEAYLIAVFSGQILHRETSNILFSEDLY